MFSEVINFHVSADRCVDEKFDRIATGLQIVSNVMRDRILIEHLLARGRGRRQGAGGRGAMASHAAHQQANPC